MVDTVESILGNSLQDSPQTFTPGTRPAKSSRRGALGDDADPGGGASIDSGIASETDTYLRTRPTRLTSCSRINRGRADPRKACSAAAYYAGTHP